MSELLYKTSRRLNHSTRATSFNPEFNPIQTSYQTGFTTKRKSQSQRYDKEIRANTRTINYSDLKQHNKTLSLDKQNELHPLPEIVIPKNKRGAKKGSFLEIWLNQALQQGQNNQTTQNINDQTLGALKTYGLDKKLLKSKNVSEQTIQKIYKKLYIYSRGLSLTFQQISKLASSKSPEQNSQSGNGIIEIFWKAFTKIMQNQTPYQTTFQMIQKNHLKNIQQLKFRTKRMNEQYEYQNKKIQEEIKRLMRDLQTFQNKYRQLEVDHKVIQSTLQLTDQTLQKEVQLRLKFQQKINSVYTSYQEIRSKYMILVQELKMNSESYHQQQKIQKTLKSQLQAETIKSHQLQHLLEIQRNKLQDLRAQIVIKKQQNCQLQMTILHFNQTQKKQEDAISQEIQKRKLVYTLLEQAKIEQARCKQLLQQQKQISKKLQKRITQLSQQNNLLYIQKHKIYQENQNSKSKCTHLNTSNQLKQQKIKSLQCQTQQNKRKYQELENQLKRQKDKSTDLTQKLQIKNSLLIKLNQNFQKVKQVKDRHQRMQTLAQLDKQEAIQQKIAIMSKLCQQQLQIEQLLKKVEQIQVQAGISVNKFNKSKQLLNRKIFQLQQNLDKKQQSLLTYLNTIQVQRIEVTKKQRQIQRLKQIIEVKQNKKLQLESKNLYLQSNQPLIQEKLKRKQIECNQKQKKEHQTVQNQSIFKNKICQIESMLNIKTNQVSIQAESLKKLSQLYRLLYEQRRQYVHPMIFQDILASSLKWFQDLKQTKNKLKKSISLNQQYLTKLQQLEKQHASLKAGFKELNTNFKQVKINNNSLQSQNHRLISQLKQQVNKSYQFAQNQKRFRTQINDLKIQIKDLNNQKQQHILRLSNKNEQIQNIKLEIKNQNIKIQEQQRLKNQNLKRLYTANKLVDELKQKNQFQNKKQKRSTKLDKQAQTDYQQVAFSHIGFQTKFNNNYNKQSNQINELNHENDNINQMQDLQSKEIRKQLLQHSNNYKEQEDNEKQIYPHDKISSPENKQKQKHLNQKKKIEKKDFKRALKLTFMRR